MKSPAGSGSSVFPASSLESKKTWDCLCFFADSDFYFQKITSFVHLPFPLEVKCEGFRTGFNVCYKVKEPQNRNMSVSDTDRFIYILILKKKEFLPCDTTF